MSMVYKYNLNKTRTTY